MRMESESTGKIIDSVIKGQDVSGADRQREYGIKDSNSAKTASALPINKNIDPGLK
jgi:hypothetical protein